MEAVPAPGAPPAGTASAPPRLSGLAVLSLLLGILAYVPFVALAFFSLVRMVIR